MTTAQPARIAVKYFVQIQELTAHNTVSASENVVSAPRQSSLVSMVEPYAMYAPFVLSGLLFIIAFGMFFMNRVHNWKNVMTAFILALMIAGIPTILTYVGQGSRQNVTAGPEEIPRNVQVTPASPTSVSISWETDAARVGVVRLSKTPFTLQTARVYIADNQASVRTHSVKIDRLIKKESYEFEIMSGTTWYDNNGAYIRFTVP
jgi:hypothetical protein